MLKSTLWFVLLNVDVEDVNTNQLKDELKTLTFENIKVFTKYLVNRKLNSEEFDLLTVENMVDYFNDLSSIDGQWLTYTHILS